MAASKFSGPIATTESRTTRTAPTVLETRSTTRLRFGASRTESRDALGPTVQPAEQIAVLPVSVTKRVQAGGDHVAQRAMPQRRAASFGQYPVRQELSRDRRLGRRCVGFASGAFDGRVEHGREPIERPRLGTRQRP